MSQQPTIPSTDRIRDLSSISAEVPNLLTSASAALTALTGRVPPSGDSIPSSPTDATPAPSLEASKAAFTENAQAYFTTLQALMARLRRQAYALEEADIIAPEATTLQTGTTQTERVNANQGAGVRRGAPTPAAKPEEGERITHGGLGNLDVAWLNSRVGEGGLDKEGEVLEQAKRMLETALGQQQGDTDMENGG